MAAAEDARREKNFESERHHFDAAARASDSSAEHIEARYRKAHSWLREGHLQRGASELEQLGRKYPHSPRAARAWLDAARTRERLGEFEKAKSNYRTVFEQYPESGGAEAAATRFVALQNVGGSPTEIAQSFKFLIEKNQNQSLDEVLRYRYAQCLEAVSKLDAIVAYETVALSYPLPKGTYADEALLRSAELRYLEGDFLGAEQTLRLLGNQGGDAAFVGSYRRPAYARALYLLGLILAQDLKRPIDAVSTWNELIRRFPDSRLVDDAFWQILISERSRGESGCDVLRQMGHKTPDSRYLVCEAVVCKGGSLRMPEHKKCAAYLDEAGRVSQ